MFISKALFILLSATAALAHPGPKVRERRASKPAAKPATFAATTAATSECLIFEDDFNTFDVKTWKHDLTLGGGGNWEFEWYTNNRTNSFVKDGILYLNPTLTADNIGLAQLSSGYTLSLWGNDPPSWCTGNNWYGCSRDAGGGGNILNPIQSALLRTAESVTLKFGRVEVRAKLPKGDWIWPAIWLLPRYQAYGNWPASGEIDIMESRGNVNYPDSLGGGVNTISSTLHWGPSFDYNRYSETHQSYKLPSGTFADDFHTYGFEWTAAGITTYVDNTTILNVPFTTDFWTKGAFPSYLNNPWAGATNAAPFDQEFYLVMNVAVGGTNGYFDDTAPNKPWQDASANGPNEFWAGINQWYPTWGSGQNLQAAMAIDSVKIWSGDGNCGVVSTSSVPPATSTTPTSSVPSSSVPSSTKTTTSTTSTSSAPTSTTTSASNVCNGQYFDTTKYVCINGFLCPIGTQLCGTNTCYDPTAYVCCSGALKQKGQSC